MLIYLFIVKQWVNSINFLFTGGIIVESAFENMVSNTNLKT